MSSRYTNDGKRKSSMTHAQRVHHCSCGKTVSGNGGKSSHRTGRSWSVAITPAGRRALRQHPDSQEPR